MATGNEKTLDEGRSKGSKLEKDENGKPDGTPPPPAGSGGEGPTDEGDA